MDKILREREERYGHFAIHAAIAQGIQNEMTSTAGWRRLNRVQRQALIAISDKIARILNGDPYYIDSWRDVAGYASLVVRCLNETEGATDAAVSTARLKNGVWESC